MLALVDGLNHLEDELVCHLWITVGFDVQVGRECDAALDLPHHAFCIHLKPLQVNEQELRSTA